MSQAVFNTGDFTQSQPQTGSVVNFGGLGFESRNTNFLNYEEVRLSDILKSRLDLLIDELDLLGLHSIKSELQKYKNNNIFNYYNIASYLDTFVSFLVKIKKDASKSPNNLVSNRILTINDEFYARLASEIRRYMNARNKFELWKIKGDHKDITQLFSDGQDFDEGKKKSFFKFW